MISVNNLSIHFTGTDLFDDVSFVIADRDRIGLVGKNGAGKTTLMRIIAGMQEPETGTVVIPPGTTIGFLPQEMNFNNSDKSLLEEAMTAFEEALMIEENIRRLTSEIASRTDFESEDITNCCMNLPTTMNASKCWAGKTCRAKPKRYCWDWVSCTVILDRVFQNSAAVGRCAWSLQRYCCKNPVLCCSTNPPITSILNPFNGWKIS